MTIELEDPTMFEPIFPSDSLAIIRVVEDVERDDVHEAVDLLLQYGVNVLVTTETLDPNERSGYSLVLEPEEIDIQSLRTLLNSNGIEVVDGFTR